MSPTNFETWPLCWGSPPERSRKSHSSWVADPWTENSHSEGTDLGEMSMCKHFLHFHVSGDAHQCTTRCPADDDGASCLGGCMQAACLPQPMLNGAIHTTDTREWNFHEHSAGNQDKRWTREFHLDTIMQLLLAWNEHECFQWCQHESAYCLCFHIRHRV